MLPVYMARRLISHWYSTRATAIKRNLSNINVIWSPEPTFIWYQNNQINKEEINEWTSVRPIPGFYQAFRQRLSVTQQLC